MHRRQEQLEIERDALQRALDTLRAQVERQAAEAAVAFEAQLTAALETAKAAAKEEATVLRVEHEAG